MLIKFKMLMNKFLYRWDGLLVIMGIFIYKTQFYYKYLFVPPPGVSFPPTQIYLVSLFVSICSAYFSIHFPPPCQNVEIIVRTVLYKCHIKVKKEKASLPCFAGRATTIFSAMPRAGNPYCREEDLCSDEEGVDELVEALASMSCRPSGLPPLRHAYATSSVLQKSMSCQCDLGREAFKFLKPLPDDATAASTPTPSSRPPKSSKKKRGKGPKQKETTSASLPPNPTPAPRERSNTTSSPVRAPPSTDAPMEVDGDAAQPQAVDNKDARPKKRYRRKRKPAPSAQKTPTRVADARHVINYKQDESDRQRTKVLLDAGFPLHTPDRRRSSSRPSTPSRRSPYRSGSRAPSSPWRSPYRQRSYAEQSEYEAREHALASRRPSTPRFTPPRRLVVTTPNRRTPSPRSRDRGYERSGSRTPGRPTNKSVKFQEPTPLPSALKPSSSSSSNTFRGVRDVRVSDGHIDASSVRVESTGTSSPPAASSSTSERPPNGSSRKKGRKRHSKKEDSDPPPLRAAPGWLAISGRSEASGPSSTPSSASSTLSSSAPAPSSSHFDANALQRQLKEQQTFLAEFFEKQQSWAKKLEFDAQARNIQLGKIADELKTREERVIERGRELCRKSSASASNPQPSTSSHQDEQLSDPSSSWSEGPSSP